MRSPDHLHGCCEISDGLVSCQTFACLDIKALAEPDGICVFFPPFSVPILSIAVDHILHVTIYMFGIRNIFFYIYK